MLILILRDVFIGLVILVASVDAATLLFRAFCSSLSQSLYYTLYPLTSLVGLVIGVLLIKAFFSHQEKKRASYVAENWPSLKNFYDGALVYTDSATERKFLRDYLVASKKSKSGKHGWGRRVINNLLLIAPSTRLFYLKQYYKEDQKIYNAAFPESETSPLSEVPLNEEPLSGMDTFQKESDPIVTDAPLQAERQQDYSISADSLYNGTFENEMVVCRKIVDETKEETANSQQRTSAPKEKKRLLVPLLIVSVLLFCSLFFNWYIWYTGETERLQLSMQNADLRKAEKKLQESIKAKDMEISFQKSRVSTLQSQVTASNLGTSFYNALNDFNYGNKYTDYYSDTEVVVVHVGKTTSLTVSYSIPSPNRPILQASNRNAAVKWGDWIDNTSCAVKITGRTAGTMTITFTNEFNSHSFQVLVLVLP